MENLNKGDTNCTLVELEANLSSAFSSNKKLEIAKAAIELGSFVTSQKIANFQSVAIQSVVKAQQEEICTYHYLNEIEKVLTDIFREALNAHIEKKGWFDFYTRSYGGKVDKFDDEIATQFGFKIVDYEHNDTDLELMGYFVGDLKKVFVEQNMELRFCAAFCDGSGEGDGCYTNTQSFHSVTISRCIITEAQFNQIIPLLRQLKVQATS